MGKDEEDYADEVYLFPTPAPSVEGGHKHVPIEKRAELCACYGPAWREFFCETLKVGVC